jgi:hypothetical protein
MVDRGRWPRQRSGGLTAERMIVVRRQVSDATTEPTPPLAQATVVAPTPAPPEPIDPRLVAARVYALLRQELAIDHERRGRVR